MATIVDLVPAVVKLLGNRGDVAALATQAIADSIIEITNNYPFEELRETGPLVQFTAGQNQYVPSFFVQPPIGGITHVWNKLVSWFFYLQPPVNLSTIGSIGYANPGYNLRFRDIEDLEVLANTLSLPQFWSQLGNGFLYVAATPNLPYFTYQRYQWLHPFTSPAALNSDPVYVTQLWWDIFEYAAAERVALKLRMQDVADRMHNKLYGDPEFQRSSGGRGEPGLIARRISQTQKNQSRSTRSVRMIGRQGY